MGKVTTHASFFMDAVVWGAVYWGSGTAWGAVCGVVWWYVQMECGGRGRSRHCKHNSAVAGIATAVAGLATSQTC